MYESKCNAHIAKINTLNGDTNTLRIQYEYTQKQCMAHTVWVSLLRAWIFGIWGS